MSSSQIAPARPASTVIVMREANPFEILMVRRADKVAFMAGSYVFPGGRVDEGDRPPAGERLPPAAFPDLTDEEEATYRMAAVRELQEEANVYITVDDLRPFAHWVTPEIETRRFDTRFFLARMPDGQQAKHDEGETTALEWLSPNEAIARFKRRELMLPPPTWTSIRQLAKRTSIEDVLQWAASRPIVRVMPGFVKNEREFILMLPGDPLLPTIPGWEIPEETRFVLQEGGRWEPVSVPIAPPEAGPVIMAIDQVIAFFNARKMDLPDSLFDRKTQFVINGAPFETLLGEAQSPNDPLILMLTRGPAGFRFTSKGLQHALPDARVSRGQVAGDASSVKTRLTLSGTLRDSGEAIDSVVDITLRLTPAGTVGIAEASMDPGTLEKIRQARRS